MRNRNRWCAAACVVGLLSGGAVTADPTLFFGVVQRNGEVYDPPGLSSIQADPGDILEVEMYGRDWSPNGERLRGYQVSIDYASYFTGSAGDILPHGFSTYTDPDGVCPSTPAGPGGNPNLFIDSLYHPWYLLPPIISFPIPNATTCDYRVAGAALFCDFTCPTYSGKPGYFGTVILEVSDDADGVFSLEMLPDPASFLLDKNGDPIGPLAYDTLTVCVNAPCGGNLQLVHSRPACDRSLWRSQNNFVRLTFDGDITAPAPGDIAVTELLPGGGFGPDLSAGFTFTVDPYNAGNLKIWESGMVLTNRT